MRVLALLTCLVAASACDEKAVAGPSGPIDRQVVLAPGNTAVIAEAGISVRFTGVPNDSRCPGDVTCVLSGDAIVRIEVLPQGAGLSQYDLHTTNPKSVTHGDLTIALVLLEPYPFVSKPIQPGDYRATLRVTR